MRRQVWQMAMVGCVMCSMTSCGEAVFEQSEAPEQEIASQLLAPQIHQFWGA